MIALKNCKAVTISDGILDNATILIEDYIRSGASMPIR